MSGIGIITNPHSKSNKRNPERSGYLSYIVGKKGFLEITNSLDDLDRAARFFLEHQIEILAINGGDGTISHTLSAFCRVYGDHPMPKILLLGGGTMNVLTWNLGLGGSPEGRLAQIVESMSTEATIETRNVSSIQIGDMHGFLYADGSSALILKEFYRHKTGYFGAAWLGIRLVFSALFQGALFRRCIQARDVIFHPKPHVPFEHASLGTFATTLAFLPLKIPMFGRAVRSGPKFRAATMAMKPSELVYRLGVLGLYAKQGHFWGKHNFDTAELVVGSKVDFPYTLDGELYTSRNNTVTIKGGKNLEFIIPAKPL